MAKKKEEKVEEKKVEETKVEARKKCTFCNGSGLARPTFINSEFCPRCNGTGYEPEE